MHGSRVGDTFSQGNEVGNGAGIYVSGIGAFASLAGAATLRNNALGNGIRADAGSYVRLLGDDLDIYSNAGGIQVSGTGSVAEVRGGTIRNNSGQAVLATAGGRVEILRPLVGGGGGGGSFASSVSLPVRLTSNVGGLYARAVGKQSGGVITTYVDYNCDQEPCSTQPSGQHDFRSNNGTTSDNVFDALATGGSQVLAEKNYWGTSLLSDIQTSTDSGSLVDIDPILTLPPNLYPYIPDVSASSKSESAGFSYGARVSSGVQRLLAEADMLLSSPDSAAVAQRILAAYRVSVGDDDRVAVAEAAGRALTVRQPAALVEWAVNSAANPGPDRPWARRALIQVLMARRAYPQARDFADLLAREDGYGESDTAKLHLARALGLMVQIAVADRDSISAVAALQRLHESDPAGGADALSSVTVAFPGTAATEGLGFTGTEAALLNWKRDIYVGGGESALTLWPIPAADHAWVRIPGSTEELLKVEVFDMMGRLVLMVHDGPMGGENPAIPIGTGVLPSGLYVLRARISGGETNHHYARSLSVVR